MQSRHLQLFGGIQRGGLVDLATYLVLQFGLFSSETVIPICEYFLDDLFERWVDRLSFANEHVEPLLDAASIVTLILRHKAHTGIE